MNIMDHSMKSKTRCKRNDVSVSPRLRNEPVRLLIPSTLIQESVVRKMVGGGLSRLIALRVAAEIRTSCCNIGRVCIGRNTSDSPADVTSNNAPSGIELSASPTSKKGIRK